MFEQCRTGMTGQSMLSARTGKILYGILHGTALLSQKG